MAYATYLASVSEDQVRRLSADPSWTLECTRVVKVSHLIAYWVQVQPLGRLLGQVIDGGVILSAALWHPLRPPTLHLPDRVASVLESLMSAWKQATDEHPLPPDDWYRLEIEKVLAIFGEAAGRGHCVVSLLEPPADADQASRVRIPLRERPGEQL